MKKTMTLAALAALAACKQAGAPTEGNTAVENEAVAEIADKVAVMYGGRIVETAAVQDLFDRPSHPYTRGLLASLPTVDHAARAAGEVARLRAIPGNVVDPRNPPAGCDFNPRCAWAIEACRAAVPPMLPVEPGHATRCIRWSELDG